MLGSKIHTSKEFYFVDNLYTSNGFPISSGNMTRNS